MVCPVVIRAIASSVAPPSCQCRMWWACKQVAPGGNHTCGRDAQAHDTQPALNRPPVSQNSLI